MPAPLKNTTRASHFKAVPSGRRLRRKAGEQLPLASGASFVGPTGTKNTYVIVEAGGATASATVKNEDWRGGDRRAVMCSDARGARVFPCRSGNSTDA